MLRFVSNAHLISDSNGSLRFTLRFSHKGSQTLSQVAFFMPECFASRILPPESLAHRRPLRAYTVHHTHPSTLKHSNGMCCSKDLACHTWSSSSFESFTGMLLHAAMSGSCVGQALSSYHRPLRLTHQTFSVMQNV